MLTRVAPEIPVTNMDVSLAYYEGKLGFALAMKMPEGDYAIVERDHVALHLFEDRAKSPVSLHIFTSELEKLHTEFEGRGARMLQGIERKPWGNRDFRVADPAGNEIKFTEPLTE
jgi:catechol 2,3-dioxygenase-like lactoylglutathione lyase family enzyme